MDDEFMAEGVELSDCLNVSLICIISALSPGMVLWGGGGAGSGAKPGLKEDPKQR